MPVTTVKVTTEKTLHRLKSIGHYIDEEGIIYPENHDGMPILDEAYDLCGRLKMSYLKGERPCNISEQDRQVIEQIFS